MAASKKVLNSMKLIKFISISDLPANLSVYSLSCCIGQFIRAPVSTDDCWHMLNVFSLNAYCTYVCSMHSSFHKSSRINV